MKSKEIRTKILEFLYENRGGLVMTPDLIAEAIGANSRDVQTEVSYLEEKGFIKIIKLEKSSYSLDPRDTGYTALLEITAAGVDNVEGEDMGHKAEASQAIKFDRIRNSNISLGSQGLKQSTNIFGILTGDAKNIPGSWFWWGMSVLGGLIVLLIGAFVFGVGK